MTIAQQLKAEGKLEGEVEALRKIATKAFSKKMSFSEVKDLTGLPEQDLIGILKEVLH